MKKLVIVALLIDIVNLAVHGFTLDYLWYWFVEPMGAIPIGFLHATGLVVMVGFVTNKYNKDAIEEPYAAAYRSFVAAITFLAMGFVIQLFM